MAGWFLFSSLLSSYNKYVFGNDHMSFPCPLLMTSIHFFAQWVFAASMCTLFPVFFGAERIETMTWRQWSALSIPCGMVTAGDVGLSNMSLITISITFYTMVKASTPIFVLIWAYAFGIERITPSLIAVVIIIAIGEFLTVQGEVDFDPLGFSLCLMASLLSGARWTLVQLKLQRLDPPLKTTIATMKLLAPSMFVGMVVMSFMIEHPWDAFKGYTFHQTIQLVGLGLFGAVFAISMILCEFYLIMHASAIILMIGGVIKEMITIFVGVYAFGDELNRLNLLGCFVVFLGVVLYKVSYHLKSHEKPSIEHSSSGYEPVDRIDLNSDEEWSGRRAEGIELRKHTHDVS